ncbi:MAG: Lrp/AsnC ligand binding domain-containing protein [Actinomycetota bacterium]
MITAFVLIGAEPDAIAELAPALAEIDGVREAHSVAGGETDLVAVLRVPTHQDIATVVTERIAKLPGVTTTGTMIAFRSYSADQMQAGYEGFGD